jgi:galactokinase
MGDHTDYQDGWCLPVAIDREVVGAAAPRDDGRIVVESSAEAGVAELAADGSDDPRVVEPAWARYVAGVARATAEAGRPAIGCDLTIASTVPAGSGLSSSAALEVAVALAMNDAAGFTMDGTDLARACQRAEHLASGVPCGVMDQMASVHGRAGHALLLDCRSLVIEPVALPTGLDIVAVHCGVPRQLATSEYAARRAACEAAAARSGGPSLRDAPTDAVAGDPIARHVVSENARVHAMVDALRDDDRDAIGELMAASHASLQYDFEVSTPELDALVDALVRAGAVGARLTGAGFGGCVVAITDRASTTSVIPSALINYEVETGRHPSAYPCRAVDGAGLVVPA